MALRRIHLLESPVLRQRATEVESVDGEVLTLIRDLFDTMYAAEGIGLAANQVGATTRVAVVDAEGAKIVLINPVVVESEGKARDEEGCLSIPDIFGDVDRAESIVIESTNIGGEREQHGLKGLVARAVLHEIDHLDGVLFLDHLSPLKRRLLKRRLNIQK